MTLIENNSIFSDRTENKETNNINLFFFLRMTKNEYKSNDCL